MSFFSNRDLNFLNAHYGLRAMGWEMCSMFTLAYLYKQGLSLPLAFTVYAGMLFVRTLTRPIAMWLCLKKGVHFTLMIGTAVFACRYPAMLPIKGLSWMLAPFMLVSGLADVLYWVPYHNYFASIGDSEDRGSSVGIRDAIATVVAVIGPVFGGLLLAVNAFYAFMMPFVLTLIAVLPLLKTPSLPLPAKPTAEEKKHIDPFGFIVFIGDGLFYQAGAIWPLIVFMILSENYGNFGFILALAAFFRAMGSMLFGKMIDKGKGALICYIGYGMHIAILTIRGLFAYTVPVIIACDFFAAIAYCFSMTGLMTAVYNATKKAKHPLYFTYYTELGWDVGAVSAMLMCAGLTALDINLRWGLIISIAGAALKIFVLGRYYRKHGNHG
ncbi:MAG: MFS transporter [Alphaproteobacteria bacterium]|nr:MFS transporter [Alphaproteobacteria bacterium]